MQAYCVKCRTKGEMKDAKAITMKNGKSALRGCARCAGRKCSGLVRVRSIP